MHLIITHLSHFCIPFFFFLQTPRIWDGFLPFPFCALLISLPPGFVSLLSSSSSWTRSWCLTITASVSRTHIQCRLHWHRLVNVYSPPPAPPLHSEWLFSAALVCASLLLYSGSKSTQLVLLWLIYSVSLCTAIKAVVKHLDPQSFTFPKMQLVICLLFRAQDADGSFTWCNTNFL